MKHPILHPLLCAALTFGAVTATLSAQSPAPDAGASPAPPADHHGPPPGHHGPPPSPLFRALDTNGDGVISADEIANASAALKTLAGASGQITREALRPPHPPQDEQRQGGDDRPRPHRPPPPPDAAPDDNPGGPASRPARADASPAPAVSPAAAGGPPGHRHHGPPPGDRLFDTLDTNGDGVISADEMAAAATALKKAANRDGVIDRRDFRPPPPPPAPAD